MAKKGQSLSKDSKKTHTAKVEAKKKAVEKKKPANKRTQPRFALPMKRKKTRRKWKKRYTV